MNADFISRLEKIGAEVLALAADLKRFGPEEWRFITAKSKSVFLMPDKIDGCVNLISASEMERMLANVRERALTDPECYQALQVIAVRSMRWASVWRELSIAMR